MGHALALLTRGMISEVHRISAQASQVPISPTEAQSLLNKTLELPLPSGMKEPLGIFQSDVIIRTAIIAAFADLRANPWLLDYVFASLPRDSLTMRDYGEQEVARAKEWFLTTDIKVMLGVRPPDGAPPPVCVTINLAESSEAENTVGDTHYVPVEETEVSHSNLTQRFDPISYSAGTGILVLPPGISQYLTISKEMAVYDRAGRPHQIQEVLNPSTVRVAAGTVADFHGCFIKSTKPSYVASLESASFKEVFIVGCHVVNEPVHLTYLHSLVVFCLLRYRQSLLEARGFERSLVSSADLKLDEYMMPEMYFTRYVTMTGYVRQYWPKAIVPKVLGVDTHLAASSATNTNESQAPAVLGDEKIKDIKNVKADWLGDQDGIGLKIDMDSDD